jgi:hypothetical protein
MIIFAHAHNLKIDANIAHIIGKPARSRDWFVREALRLKVGEYVKQEMFPSDEFPAPFDKEKHMEPIGEEYQRYSHAQWQDAHQQADSIDFHEAKMEGAASTLSHGGASTDSLEYVYSPGDDDPILQQKKASPYDSANEWNGGFAKRGWSRSLNGFSNSTLANTYLDRSLTAFQRKQLCDCYADISKLSNGLEGQELHDQVAALFNRRHIAQFSEDQCGYGGLIRETRVAEFLKEQGSVLLQGRLGVRAFPYLAVAPTPILPYFYVC